MNLVVSKLVGSSQGNHQWVAKPRATTNRPSLTLFVMSAYSLKSKRFQMLAWLVAMNLCEAFEIL